jgi:uncharacterized protein YndB with AHSA1/START domain
VTSEEAAGAPLEVEVRVEARPESVFRYFVEPDLYVRWQGSRADLDPRPGGRFRVLMEDGSVASGEYLEVDPPRRVSFSWGWEGKEDLPPGSTTVEVTLEPDGDATVVRLRHTGLPTDDWRRVHRDGWVSFLGTLAGLP